MQLAWGFVHHVQEGQNFLQVSIFQHNLIHYRKQICYLNGVKEDPAMSQSGVFQHLTGHSILETLCQCWHGLLRLFIWSLFNQRMHFLWSKRCWNAESCELYSMFQLCQGSCPRLLVLNAGERPTVSREWFTSTNAARAAGFSTKTTEKLRYQQHKGSSGQHNSSASLYSK